MVASNKAVIVGNKPVKLEKSHEFVDERKALELGELGIRDNGWLSVENELSAESRK